MTVATHRRTVEVLEAPQYEGEVVSATSEHALIVLPDWSADHACMVRRGTDAWPKNPAPAMRIRYQCAVRFDNGLPVILACFRHQTFNGASPLVPPAGLPGPPDLLPLHGSVGDMLRVLKPLRLKKPKSTAIVYLIRRAHGQGWHEARRDR